MENVNNVNIYIDSIKEIIAEDGGLSWKYVVNVRDDELKETILEYWELNLNDHKTWEKKCDFRIDQFCAKRVFEAGLNMTDVQIIDY